MKALKKLLLFALVSSFLAGCYQVPVTGRHAMNLVDDKEVTKMSISMFDDMKRQYKISRDRQQIDQLRRVGDCGGGHGYRRPPGWTDSGVHDRRELDVYD